MTASKPEPQTRPVALNRWDLSEDESRVFREYVSALIFNGQVTADVAGLNTVDLFVLNLLELAHEATAGDLARRTGLTSGAVTKLVDRLERAGLVSRRHDPADRRRVLVSIVDSGADQRMGASAELFTPIARRLDRLISGLPADQRSVLINYFARATEELTEATREIQQCERGRRRPPGD